MRAIYYTLSKRIRISIHFLKWSKYETMINLFYDDQFSKIHIGNFWNVYSFEWVMTENWENILKHWENNNNNNKILYTLYCKKYEFVGKLLFFFEKLSLFFFLCRIYVSIYWKKTGTYMHHLYKRMIDLQFI